MMTLWVVPENVKIGLEYYIIVSIIVIEIRRYKLGAQRDISACSTGSVFIDTRKNGIQEKLHE